MAEKLLAVKAIRYHRYGGPEVLELQDVDMPAIGDDDVLIRVRAASVNPQDWHYMRGTPHLLRGTAGLSRPKRSTLGTDLAGQVEAVGRNVTRFQPGDEVFGYTWGAFAEYVAVRQDATVMEKPANLTFEQAAAVPVGGFTALQALCDKGRIRQGQTVLVNGAAGGVGTFTVQIAKAFGANVTGVCSTRNVEMVRSIGADQIVDYTREDFTTPGQSYDLMVDIAGNRTLSEMRRVLAPKATVVGVGGPDKGNWIGPLRSMARLLVRSLFVSQTMVPMLTRESKDDLRVLYDLLESGKVTPVIDRTHPFSELPEAIRYLETGHARGKVIVTM
jgi:NADPH:quinone reductase-like Zn-dependent oxidoreductase